MVRTDMQRLEQIVLNLQSNSLKFTPKEGSVRITVQKHFPSKLSVKIADTGEGIKQEDKPKIFKLFGFLQNTQDLNADGVGLGLYIC